MWLTRWLNRGSTNGAAILLYHRVTELDLDPFGLAVTPSNFAAQLDVLAARTTVLSLSELVNALASSSLPPRAVVVTFDDGYADNLLNAKPALERHAMPMTAFITTGALAGTREFWWDELEAVLLSDGPLPPVLEIAIGGQLHRWTLEAPRSMASPGRRATRDWRTWQEPPTRRHAIFVEVWRLLQPLSFNDRRSVLDDLARWAGCDTSAARPSHRTLSPAEVRELAADGLVKLGAHTVTHPRLSALSERDQAFELTRSRQELEEAVGHDVTALSYPYGGKNDFTAATVAAAGRAGFSCACTTIRAPVLNGADPLRLPRYVAPDVDAGRFERLLEQWLVGPS